MEPPWCDCKVAYTIDDDAPLWRRDATGRLELPANWSLDETDDGGSRLMVVFRVDVVPTVEDGRAVLSMLRRIRAIAPRPRARAA